MAYSTWAMGCIYNTPYCNCFSLLVSHYEFIFRTVPCTNLTSASTATSTQPIIAHLLALVITWFLFTLLWVLARYAGS